MNGGLCNSYATEALIESHPPRSTNFSETRRRRVVKDARFFTHSFISSSRASTRLRYVLFFWFVATPVTSPTWDVGVFLSRKIIFAVGSASVCGRQVSFVEWDVSTASALHPSLPTIAQIAKF